MSIENVNPLVMNMAKEYLASLEFAQREGANIKTINRWIKQGKIPVIKAKGKSKYRKIQNYIHYTYLSNKIRVYSKIKKRSSKRMNFQI